MKNGWKPELIGNYGKIWVSVDNKRTLVVISDEAVAAKHSKIPNEAFISTYEELTVWIKNLEVYSTENGNIRLSNWFGE